MLQKNIALFHARLHDWYAAHGRHHLPWRTTPDPYHVWISEVMLQQTQVATVLARFYHPFLEKFPTIEALANAERETVMKAWEGLGYYRRAGFLHEAAKMLVASSPRRRGELEGGWLYKHDNICSTVPVESPPLSSRSRRSAHPPAGGGFKASLPPTVEALLTLPGIGRNTAHAVASFGFGLPVPVMEANLKRVLARIFAWESPTDKQLWDAAHQLLDPQNPFDYNQAMMDIGAGICLPRRPICATCPANDICRGKTNPEAYPAPKAKKQKPLRRYRLLLPYRTAADGTRRFHLAVRETALLGGLYGFPQLPPEAGEWEYAGQSVSLAKAEGLGEVRHIFTHFTLECPVSLLPVSASLPLGNSWYSLAEIEALPIAAIDKKALALLERSKGLLTA